MADEYIVRIEDPIYIQAVSSVDPLLVYLRGYNAYEVAVQAGFEGTREEWLASLAEEATLICEGYRDEAQTARDELDPVLINIATLLAIGAKLTEIDTVSDNIDAILTVNDDLILGLSSKIGIVAGSITNVNNVGESIANVNNVGASIANVNSVAEKLTEVETVGASIDNVNNVGESIANVNSVAEKLSEVETVVGDITNIDTVAGEIDDVNTVATNIADVNLAADNIAAIQAAPTYAEAAEKWAENPEDSPVETGKYSALHHSAKASAAQTAAEAAQDKAEDWAEETEDVEVESGKYSAKHWAAKAEDVVDEAYAVVENKIDKTAVKQEIGASTTDVMSQKAVTDELAQLAGDMRNLIGVGYEYAYIQKDTGLHIPTSYELMYIVVDYEDGDDIQVLNTNSGGDLLPYNFFDGETFLSSSDSLMTIPPGTNKIKINGRMIEPPTVLKNGVGGNIYSKIKKNELTIIENDIKYVTEINKLNSAKDIISNEYKNLLYIDKEETQITTREDSTITKYEYGKYDVETSNNANYIRTIEEITFATNQRIAFYARITFLDVPSDYYYIIGALYDSNKRKTVYPSDYGYDTFQGKTIELVHKEDNVDTSCRGMMMLLYPSNVTEGITIKIRIEQYAIIDCGVDASHEFYNKNSDELYEIIKNTVATIGNEIITPRKVESEPQSSISKKEIYTIGDSLSLSGVWQSELARLTNAIFDPDKNINLPLSSGGTTTVGINETCGQWRAKNLETLENSPEVIFIENINDLNRIGSAGTIDDVPFMLHKILYYEIIYATRDAAIAAKMTAISSFIGTDRVVGAGVRIPYYDTDEVTVLYLDYYLESKDIATWDNDLSWKYINNMTLYSAYKGLISYLINRFPLSKIYWLIPTRFAIAWNDTNENYDPALWYDDDTFNVSAYRNTIKHTDYMALVGIQKTVCEMYSIQYFDMMKISGISENNIQTYYPEWNVHPYDIGYKRWGQAIAPLL